MLREAKFRLVQAIGRLTHRWLRVRDLRRDPLRGQVELRPARTVHWDLSKLTYIGPEPFWWTQEEFSLDLSYRVELPYAEMIGKGVVIMRP